MESISIQKYSMQIYAYSGSGPGGPKVPTKGGDPPAAGKANCDFRSQDGDSVTLSIEARMMQVTETNTGANSGSGGDLMNSFMKDLGGGQNSGAVQTADGSGSDDTSPADMFKSLVQKLADMLNSGSGSADAGPVEKGAQPAHGHHHGHKPQRVADKMIDHMEKEYAATGGSKQDYVNNIKKRMEERGPVSGSDGNGGQDFRGQVNALVASGLDAWAQGGDPNQATQA